MGFSGIGPLSATALVARLGELFLAGRLQEVTELWSFPCPVELGGELRVMRNAEELLGFFQHRLDRAQAVGLTGLVPRIIAIEMPRKHRFRVWFRWIHRYGDHEMEEEHSSVFYLHRKPLGNLSIEMMDIVRLPDVAAVAKSA
jgi:hypothetical protein